MYFIQLSTTKEKNYAFSEKFYYASHSFTSKTSVNSMNQKENLRFFMYFVHLSTNQGEKLRFFGEIILCKTDSSCS